MKKDKPISISDTITEVFTKRIEEKLEESMGPDEWRKLPIKEKKAMVNYQFKLFYGSTRYFFSEKLKTSLREKHKKK
jgi:hypothetical protein